MKTVKNPSKVVIIPRPPVSDTKDTTTPKQKSEEQEIPVEEVQEEAEEEGEKYDTPSADFE